MDTPPIYDREAVYDAEIAPLMAQIIAICQREKIPFVATFAYARTEEGEIKLCTSAAPGVDGWQPDEIRAALRTIRNGVNHSAMLMTVTTPVAASAEPEGGK